MAAAAAALGWPEQIVDAAHAQMKTISDMQIKTIDHIIGTWEEHFKSPNAMKASPAAMLSKLKSAPTVGTPGGWPGPEAFQTAATAPLKLWMEFGTHCQKFWMDAMKAGRG